MGVRKQQNWGLTSTLSGVSRDVVANRIRELLAPGSEPQKGIRAQWNGPAPRVSGEGPSGFVVVVGKDERPEWTARIKCAEGPDSRVVVGVTLEKHQIVTWRYGLFFRTKNVSDFPKYKKLVAQLSAVLKELVPSCDVYVGRLDKRS